MDFSEDQAFREDHEGLRSNNNNRKAKKTIMNRLWRYLKHTLTGVMTGNGNFLFQLFAIISAQQAFC